MPGMMHALPQGLRALAVTMILHSVVCVVPQSMRCPKVDCCDCRSVCVSLAL